MMRALHFIIVILLLCATAAEASAQRRKRPAKPQPPAAAAEPAPPPAPPEPPLIKPPEVPLTVEEMARLRAVIETSMGDMTIEFYAQAAPNHVRQFVWLARNGFFDGMSFSRVIPKLIIQSGNPASWEESNANHKRRFDIPKLKAEYDPNIKHERGALALARPNEEPDGGTHHFFICAVKASSLDGQYTVFGRVVNGLDVVDAIANVPIAEDTPDKPRDRIEVKRITIKEAEQ